MRPRTVGTVIVIGAMIVIFEAVDRQNLVWVLPVLSVPLLAFSFWMRKLDEKYQARNAE